MRIESSPVRDLPVDFVTDWQLEDSANGRKPERTTIKLSPRPQSGKREPGERKIAPEEVSRHLAS